MKLDRNFVHGHLKKRGPTPDQRVRSGDNDGGDVDSDGAIDGASSSGSSGDERDDGSSGDEGGDGSSGDEAPSTAETPPTQRKGPKSQRVEAKVVLTVIGITVAFIALILHANPWHVLWTFLSVLTLVAVGEAQEAWKRWCEAEDKEEAMEGEGSDEPLLPRNGERGEREERRKSD